MICLSGINVQLSVKEIYDKVCPKCKKKIEALIREHISDELVKGVIGKA